MTDQTRRNALRTGLAAASGFAGTLLPSQSQAQESPQVADEGLLVSTSNNGWAGVKVINTPAVRWTPVGNTLQKMLFWHRDSDSHLMLVNTGPGWSSAAMHYHEFHEWGYWLSGDLVSNEYVTPDQSTGIFTHYREGCFLDRPAYSLHGIEPTSLPSQQGCIHLVQQEGWGSLGPFASSSDKSDTHERDMEYTMPRIIDTVSQLDWRDEGNIEGLKTKRLADDANRGYRVNLFWLPAGWDSSYSDKYSSPFYYHKAREFNYVLYGDMTLQTYKSPGQKAERITVRKDHYFERGPKAISGPASGTVTEQGCVWLQVTYAIESAVESSMPIEEPTLL